MSTCTVSANQPIYQALLDKAASYPTDKPYQAKAYKKAAESVLTYYTNIYDEIAKYNRFYGIAPTNVGVKIEDFIYEFIKATPTPARFSEKAMDDARKAAAAAAPKDVTTWPKDDAERTAFQARLVASKVTEIPAVKEAFDQLRTALNMTAKPIGQPKPVETPQSSLTEAASLVRRSRRIANKPKVEYFNKDDESDNDISDDSDEEYIDEEDDVVEVIEAVCDKKGWTYSDSLLTEFNAWLPTADKYSLEKYNWKTQKYIPRTKIEMAKYWAQYYSSSLQKQEKQEKLNKSLIKYCEKNTIQYDPKMTDKFAAWMADPANKKLITATYTSYIRACTCTICDPTGEKKKAAETKTIEYRYDRSPAYCINKWFSTLKKTIVW